MTNSHYLQFLYLQLNRSCNYRCNHCDFWKLDEDPKGLKDEQYGEILCDYDDLLMSSDALYKANVVTCGGEPMLNLDRYFYVAGVCDSFSMNMMSVTNGSIIKNDDIARRVVVAGPHEITVSLDGPDAAIHDRMRGVSGSFEAVTTAVRRLIEQREKVRPKTTSKIYVMTLVCQSLVGKLDGFYDFVLNDLRADKLKLNIIQPTFGSQGGHDMFFGSEAIQDPDALIAEIKACDVKYSIDRNPQWLIDVRMYLTSLLQGKQVYSGWRSKHQTSEHICDTYERNVMVDVYGNMRLCFSEAFPSVQWKQRGDLKRFWNEAAPLIAERMKTCNRYCGISHSVRKEPSTLSGREKKFNIVPY